MAGRGDPDPHGRLVVRVRGDESGLLHGTVRRDGDEVVISWEDGGSDTLGYIGAVSQ